MVKPEAMELSPSSKAYATIYRCNIIIL